MSALPLPQIGEEIVVRVPSGKRPQRYVVTAVEPERMDGDGLVFARMPSRAEPGNWRSKERAILPAWIVR